MATDTDPAPNASVEAELGDDGMLFVEEQRFAVVPEWVIDSELSDAAFRVYSLLLRFGNGSGNRMPSRKLLARRLHRSVDSIDRAMRELESATVVRVERRRQGAQNLTNRYHVRTSPPAGESMAAAGGRTPAATPGAAARGSRGSAATRQRPLRGDRTSAATPGRTDTARVAAEVRPDREKFTDTPPPPAPPRPRRGARRREEEVDTPLLELCGIDDLQELADRCLAARRAVGRPVTRWEAPCLTAALQVAVRVRGWPASLARRALLAVAADPDSRSPMRLAEAGPWWDIATDGGAVRGVDLAELERRLDDTNGRRPRLQAQARAELERDGLPLTRVTVVERACAILDRQVLP